MACLSDHDDSTFFEAIEILKEKNFSIITDKSTCHPVEQVKPIDTSTCSVQHHVVSALPTNHDEVRRQINSNQKVSIRVITWNQEARPHPCREELRKYLIPLDHYHIIAVGTQECENSIAVSLINPSKAKWEENVTDVVGSNYCKVCDRVLQAIYL
jgi:hypothetical protein